MSARRSRGVPAACSGLMYAAVPRMIPACVIASVVIVGDCDTLGASQPKLHRLGEAEVQHFAVPSGRTLMFAGFRSR